MLLLLYKMLPLSPFLCVLQCLRNVVLSWHGQRQAEWGACREAASEVQAEAGKLKGELAACHLRLEETDRCRGQGGGAG